MRSTVHDARNGLVCAGIAIVALLLAWPFANLPFNDDFTWSFTVQRLLETGHLQYNGWSSPPLIAGAYWGLIWVKLFGFSLNVLRISTLPFAAGAVWLCYAIARQAGLTTAMSIFAALMLGLSPVFMPLASTFMTDVPGLFFLLLSIYAMVRGFDSSDRSAAIGWLIAGTAAALIGGSSRQVVWIAPLATLPYVAWIRRADRSFAIAAVFSWLAVFGGAVLMQHWFARQPYALPDPPLTSYFRVAVKERHDFVNGLIGIVLTMMLLILPAAVGTLRDLLRVRTLIGMGFLLVIGGFLIHRHGAMPPWIGNIISTVGVLGWIELHGGQPTVLPVFVRFLLSLGVLVSLSMLIASAVVWISSPGQAWRQIKTYFLQPPERKVVTQVLLLTLAGLAALESTRSVFKVAYDRHLLALIPFAAIPLLVRFRHNGVTKMPRPAWAVLVCFGLFAVASTQQVNALARARVRAIQHLADGGVAGLHVDGGFEHNFWVQLQATGHINDPRITNPPGTYQDGKGLTPSLFPLYRLESAVTPETAATPFGAEPYFSLLPPFHRLVMIDRLLDPAASGPSSKVSNYIPKTLLDQYRSTVPNSRYLRAGR